MSFSCFVKIRFLNFNLKIEDKVTVQNTLIALLKIDEVNNITSKYYNPIINIITLLFTLRIKGDVKAI